jgi:hypothetical protein
MWCVLDFLPFEMHILRYRPYYPPSLKCSSLSNGFIQVPLSSFTQHRFLDHERSGFSVHQKVKFQFLSHSTSYNLCFRLPSSTNLSPSVRIIFECIEVAEERTIKFWTKGHDFPRPATSTPCLACLRQLPVPFEEETPLSRTYHRSHCSNTLRISLLLLLSLNTVDYSRL